jgi:hypothetical protein
MYHPETDAFFIKVVRERGSETCLPVPSIATRRHETPSAAQ